MIRISKVSYTNVNLILTIYKHVFFVYLFTYIVMYLYIYLFIYLLKNVENLPEKYNLKEKTNQG